mmetsp:Transcript_24957/g.68802  ORF Transcript_24957/g.68802 Transcript_24957/m.68802 type:complete len:509 (-) Transcript_24957:783-2309(-)|eukprot:CAMPEP_0172363362 /NCGR_PEP_ID=MMETSP1060-20121228/6746_1 /TAXON_ID=37318 /ORGANISM="Pseudo-nitzschia pungens, Strain cf. cingulata" /LENGTH=508 /DNA_ID=CAMNT_0013086089 /DNA_START=397 /DNA_END=1923 /DNA_ORIENTATION=+
MDHLKTSQERRDRWYARHIVPEYATVRSVTLDEIRRCAQRQPQPQPSKPNVPPHGAQRCGGAIVIGGMPSSLLFHKTHRHEARTYLRRDLEEHGFAVIQGVLDDSECNHALSLAWDYLEAASSAERKFRESFRTTRTDAGSDSISIGTAGEDTAGDPSPSLVVVRRGDRGTYRSPNFPRFVEGRIFPFYGSGHSSFLWYLRSHPGVQRVFAAIHDLPCSFSTETLARKQTDLVTSLDGMILWTDADGDADGADTGRGNGSGGGGGGDDDDDDDDDDCDDGFDRGWFHVDQSPERKPGFASFQGLVNLLPVTPEIGGNVVVVGSHRLFPDHFLEDNEGLFYNDRLKELGGDDWMEIDPKDSKLFGSGPAITCLLGPGDVLIWDSRTVHRSHREKRPKSDAASRPTAVSSENPDPFESQLGLVRAAGLVNMVPRYTVVGGIGAEALRRARLSAVSGSRTLTHWVDKAAPLGDERQDEVRKESACVKYMNDNERTVLLSYEDLSTAQRNLL